MTLAAPCEVTIRPAETRDAAAIVALVRELAAYEGLLDQVELTEADIARDGFGPRPAFECLLAEAGNEAVGFALFFQNCSTFRGRAGIYLEDLFVRAEVRAPRRRSGTDEAARRADARAGRRPAGARRPALEPRSRLL